MDIVKSFFISDFDGIVKCEQTQVIVIITVGTGAPGESIPIPQVTQVTLSIVLYFVQSYLFIFLWMKFPLMIYVFFVMVY